MKILFVVCNSDPEIIWNAFRLANIMLEQGEDVTIFLNGASVKYGSLSSGKFPLNDLAKIFTLSEGILSA